MHERALMTDLMREIEARRPCRRRHARDARLGAPRSALALHAGALPRALRRRVARHVAEGAAVDAVLADDLDDPRATGVVLESVEVEVPDAEEPG